MPAVRPTTNTKDDAFVRTQNPPMSGTLATDNRTTMCPVIRHTVADRLAAQGAPKHAFNDTTRGRKTTFAYNAA